MPIIRISYADLFQSPNQVAYHQPGELSGRAAAAGYQHAGAELSRAFAQIEGYQRHQTDFAAASIGVRLKIEADSWEREQLARTDLQEIQPNTNRTGYQQAPDDYADYLKRNRESQAQRLPHWARQEFLAKQELLDDQRHAAFSYELVDREMKERALTLKQQIRELATGQGQVDPITGVAAQGTSDPLAGLQHAREQVDSLPVREQAGVLDYALRETVYGLMRVNPQDAIDFLDRNRAAFEPDDWMRLQDAAEKYASADHDWQLRQQEQTRQSVQSEIDTEMQNGNFAAVQQKIERNRELLGEREADKLLTRAVQIHTEPETKPAAFNQAAEAQLKAAAGETKPADARETAAGLRFDQQKLSPDDYAQIRSWQDVDPVTAHIMLGAIDSVKRQVKVGVRHRGLFQADTDKTLAATTRFIAERAAQAKESGKPLDPADLDQAARQFAAAQGQQALKDFAAGAPPKEQDIDITGVPAPKAKAKPTYPQMRRDTPPELRDRIKRLLDAGADPEEVFKADEVKPYVLRGQ